MQFLAVSVACAEVSSCALYVLGHSVHDNSVVVVVKYPILHKHSLPVPLAEFVGHSHMMLVIHNNRHHTHQIQFCDLYIIYVMQTLKSPYIYVHNMKKNTLTSGRLCVLLPAFCTVLDTKNACWDTGALRDIRATLGQNTRVWCVCFITGAAVINRKTQSATGRPRT